MFKLGRNCPEILWQEKCEFFFGETYMESNTEAEQREDGLFQFSCAVC